MRVDTISEPPTRVAEEAHPESTAAFRSRVGGYVVDMVIFAAIAMLVVVVAGAVILISTDGAEQNATNAELYTFVAIVGLGTPLVWTLLNLPLLAMRGQTGGQYVAGVRIADADGATPGFAKASAWWFCANPLLFSWPMALVAGAPVAALVALVTSAAALFLLALIVLLCVAAPLVAFVSALIDDENRALHDRIVSTYVLPVGDR